MEPDMEEDDREFDGEPADDEIGDIRRKAKAGDPMAQDQLGDCYKHGLGVERDYQRAVEWHQKSAAQGNAAAQRSLGYCYHYGQGVDEQKVL